MILARNLMGAASAAQSAESGSCSTSTTLDFFFGNLLASEARRRQGRLEGKKAWHVTCGREGTLVYLSAGKDATSSNRTGMHKCVSSIGVEAAATGGTRLALNHGSKKIQTCYLSCYVGAAWVPNILVPLTSLHKHLQMTNI